ncbi:acyl-CoA dehydrogenase family protein [Pseudomonas mediterranea]|uniref:Acyl-CoA dehydrogenase n=1 Tax=Pseudomonas mediterranea TaxID=183795 RepID=A0AAX2DCX5_9PSED|nr:acyl-CoA dehydrogenase family protein [Pseudomonas mediterranea]MBL0841800.1 acyl-CoA dehydrogenase family protein [Pseudomonas mediterranea]MDU9029480.1 acyl-CoA dehydrogenase family protein [Pseudomonas mediterranea]UZD98796.1 acyl-CoA dehydrogenase family protein [Pseudomonas mediterranea]CAH0223372.1 Acyl-CoA dehydrogenase [Pseudomonas mediterranea]SDU55927.1 Acyl-CoA dehydrogenase [Pseudomonas mediterranea]
MNERMMPEVGVLADTPAVVQLNAWLRNWAKRLDFRLVDERRCLPPHWVLALGNKGLLGMQVAERDGGLLGLSNFELLRVQRQLGAIDLTLAFFVGLNNGLGIRPIQRFGSPAMKERYLPQLASGRILAAFALTEHGAGSNPLGLSATARREREGFRVDGTKSWSGSAAWAGVISVFTRHLDEQGRDCGFVGLCLDAEQPGMRQGSEALTLGLKGMVQNQVHFDAALVDADRVLGSPFAGMAVASDTMAYGRLGIAATCVGGLWRCLQLMMRYSTRRSLGSHRLWDHQHTQRVVDDALCAATAIGGWVDDLALRLDQGLPEAPPQVLAAVKWMASEMLGEVSDAALQMLGARGYCDNNPIGRLWRDARITRLFEGPSETLATFIGQRVQEQPVATLDYLEQTTPGKIAAQRLRQWLADAGPMERLSAGTLRLGECVAWLMLYAQPLDESPRQWVEFRLEQALHTWERVRSPVRAMPGLAEWINANAGLCDEPQPGEDSTIDPLLMSREGL